MNVKVTLDMKEVYEAISSKVFSETYLRNSFKVTRIDLNESDLLTKFHEVDVYLEPKSSGSCHFHILVNGIPKCSNPDVPFLWGDDPSPCCGHSTQEQAENSVKILRRHMPMGTKFEIIPEPCPKSL